MQDVVDVFRKSSEKALNMPQLVGDDDRKVIVPTEGIPHSIIQESGCFEEKSPLSH